MKKWQYNETEPHRLDKLMEVLEDLGRGGWELAAIIERRKTNQQIRYIAIVKRPIET
jgi:hypothetical protein